jgi:hypothetical protein
MANSPLCDRCVKVLHKCRIRTALEVLVTNRKDVGIVGPLWVDLTVLSPTLGIERTWWFMRMSGGTSDDGCVTDVLCAVHS